MGNSKYIAGRNFEYAVKKYLEASGYYVMRSSGSRTACDLVAFSTIDILFVQCKVESRKKNYKDDLQKLKELPHSSNTRKMLWVKNKTNIHIFDELGELMYSMPLKELKEKTKNGSN